ncbi:hypothetical protein [Defluviicoccus vanus]|uniref:Uncharacterized protein n=1 Tax=Defluviicoccus vanus TaxID=111831 RepID=A0A7H1N1Q8_9PROT|nr:hypothetical protein [Defluviicoccus vanus]QNT69644.1 hypothetical protein HQ394_10320 [Defluviicoccus vanus]
MKDDAWEGLRQDLVTRLSRLLDKALSVYAYFANSTPPEGSKDFAAFQANCRAALAHVHLLIKLAQWARNAADVSSEISPGDDDHIHQLIEEAEAALDQYGSPQT